MTHPAATAPQALLLYSLGPVQDFIASARRCQDLWYGSWLLSHLARAAADAIRQSGAELIFPPGLGTEKNDDKHAVANKILAIVPKEQVAETAKRAEAAVRAALDELARKHFTQAEHDQATGKRVFHRDNAVVHLHSLMERQWVAVPFAGKYKDARQRAETLLAARKNTRDWKQAQWDDAGVPKSSLDGVRPSVLDECLFDRRPGKGVGWSADKIRRTFGAKSTERLCGVGLLKRRGTDPEANKLEDMPAFHSTSHVAAAPLLALLERSAKAKEAWSAYLNALKDRGIDLQRFRIRCGAATVADRLGGWSGEEAQAPRVWPLLNGDDKARMGHDGYLLFPSRVHELVQEYSKVPDAQQKDAIRSLQAVQRNVLSALSKPGLGDGPPAYYGLLLADGDRMGALLDADNNQSEERHKRIAGALLDFSKSCQEIVEAHGGSLIYAGGDDVLALVPLHTALRCAKALAERFTDALAKYKGETKDVNVVREVIATLSVGIGIGHHLDPMRETLDLARKAEKLAKKERNSVALVQKKRSGGQLEWTEQWSNAPVERMEQWMALFAEDAIPNSTAFVLEDELKALRVAPFAGTTQAALVAHFKELAGVAHALAKRALSRRVLKDDAKHQRKQLDKALDTIFPTAGTDGELAGWPERLDNLVALLQLARELAVVAKLAWGPPPKRPGQDEATGEATAEAGEQ